MKKPERKQQWMLFFAIMVLGGCGLAYEYTLSKLISDLIGNSLRQWAIIIAVMMFFMGIGSDAQKHVRNERVTDFFIGGEILLGLIGGFGPLALFWVYSLSQTHYVLVQYGVVSSIGFLIGIEIPLLSRLNEKHASSLGENLGGILKMDYIGALLGALAWVFVLPRFLSYVQMGFFLGVLNLLVALATWWWFRKDLSRPRFFGGINLLGILALGVGLLFADPWASQAEQYLYSDRIVWQKTTPYQHLVLTESSQQQLALYINGHLQFHTFDEHIYHEMLVHPAMALAQHPQRVLILGGGDGLALREVLKYPQVQEVILCDLDPDITRLAAEQPHLRELNQHAFADSRIHVLTNQAYEKIDSMAVLEVRNQHRPIRQEYTSIAQVQVVHLDAYRFVEQFPGVFDVIIADFPDPNSTDLSKLYSLGFYQRLLHKLTPQGILVQQSTSPALARKAFLCVGKTMRAAGLEALPLQQNVPSFGQWGWWLAQHPAADSLQQLSRRIQSLPEWSVPLRYLTPEVVRGATVFGKNQLDDHEIEINSVVSPVIFSYYLSGWIL